MIRTELKERFIQELTPAEKIFFLKKAREAVFHKGYRPGEDLYHYCYFLTLRERMRGISPHSGEGYMRFLLVEGMRDTERAIKQYEERLEKTRLSIPAPEGYEFIEYLSETTSKD